MTKDNKALFLCSDKQRPLPPKQGHWSKDEHIRFLEGCYLYKNNWPKIEWFIQTRTIPQIRSHAQKFLIKICRKYEIKLSQKKFLKTKSKHLELAYSKSKKYKKTGLASMNKYERNIYEMFNYYKRDITTNNNNNNNTGHKNSNSNCNITTSTTTTIPETNSNSEEEIDNMHCNSNNNSNNSNNSNNERNNNNMLIDVNYINHSLLPILVYFYALNYLILIHRQVFTSALNYDNYCIYLINVLNLINIYCGLHGY